MNRNSIILTLINFKSQVYSLKRTFQMSNRRISPSPIKIKEYFTNPLHKIKQPSFLETGFNETHLNSFVKAFASKTDPNLISVSSIRKFIQSFTNGNPKLMQTYEDFFFKNFQIQQNKSGKGNDTNIELEHFLEFFLKETQHDINKFTESQWKKLFQKEFFPLTAAGLYEKSNHLEIPMTKEEAKNIVKMINLETQGKQNSNEISYESFLKAMTEQN